MLKKKSKEVYIVEYVIKDGKKVPKYEGEAINLDDFTPIPTSSDDKENVEQ